MDTLPSIECVANGPLRVKGLSSLRNSKGETSPVQPVAALCRCGGSSNKPFCDGTHRSNGFSSAKAQGRAPDEVHSYRGRHITLHDNRSVCAHAGRCTDGLPRTFRYGQEPFIDADADGVAEIIAIVAQCPSGALSYTLHAPSAAAPQPRPAEIVVTPGPYAVTGGITIDQPRNSGASPEHFTLCRCGASKNKPFCDGSHWSVGFKDDKN
jgi:CDGSH-type Zn-finger protein